MSFWSLLLQPVLAPLHACCWAVILCLVSPFTVTLDSFCLLSRWIPYLLFPYLLLSGFALFFFILQKLPLFRLHFCLIVWLGIDTRFKIIFPPNFEYTSLPYLLRFRADFEKSSTMMTWFLEWFPPAPGTF